MKPQPDRTGTGPFGWSLNQSKSFFRIPQGRFDIDEVDFQLSGTLTVVAEIEYVADET